MKLLDYNASGATIHLDGKELIAMMALIQEGRYWYHGQSRASAWPMFKSNTACPAS
jgi:hypothetical protein